LREPFLFAPTLLLRVNLFAFFAPSREPFFFAFLAPSRETSYFAVDLSVDEEVTALLIPAINDGFYGLRWGIGFDIHHFIMQLDGEFLYDISDDRDKALFMLKFGVGYAF
jgi:hypothetical protein